MGDVSISLISTKFYPRIWTTELLVVQFRCRNWTSILLNVVHFSYINDFAKKKIQGGQYSNDYVDIIFLFCIGLPKSQDAISTWFSLHNKIPLHYTACWLNECKVMWRYPGWRSTKLKCIIWNHGGFSLLIYVIFAVVSVIFLVLYYLWVVMHANFIAFSLNKLEVKFGDQRYMELLIAVTFCI